MLPDLLFPCMMNSIMSIFGAEPAAHGSARYRYLRNVGRATMKLQKGFFPMGTYSITPWLKYLVPNMIGYTNLIDSNAVIHPFIKVIITKLWLIAILHVLFFI